MIKAEEISDIIKRQLQGYEAEIDLQEAGRVIEVGDGIARIYGLEKALAGELLEFPGGVYGLVLNLEADNVGAVLLGSDTQFSRLHDTSVAVVPSFTTHRESAGDFTMSRV